MERPTFHQNNGSLFNVTMGSYDEAEICKMVGPFLLQYLPQVVGKNNIGLYRDDGLTILNNASGPSSERMRKGLIKLFQDHGLKVTTECNLVQTEYLDVTFNLKLIKLTFP